MVVKIKKISNLATQFGYLRGSILGTLLYDDSLNQTTFKNLSRDLISVLDSDSSYENSLIEQIKERAKKFDIKYVSES